MATNVDSKFERKPNEEFLLYNKISNIAHLDYISETDGVDQIVMAHVKDIISHDWYGIKLRVVDESGSAIFYLEQKPAYQFYKETVKQIVIHKPVYYVFLFFRIFFKSVGPANQYSLFFIKVEGVFHFNNQVYKTLLFNIGCPASQISSAHNTYVVKNICMNKDIIDNFQYRMDIHEYNSYRAAVFQSQSVPMGRAVLSRNFEMATNVDSKFERKPNEDPCGITSVIDLSLQFSTLHLDD